MKNQNNPNPIPADLSEVFLASIFSGEGHANQHSGLLIASSTDGVHFQNIRDSRAPIYAPPGGVRDPSLLYWQAQWYLVYSYGPNTEPVLFLARSPDLLHWIPVGSLRLAANTEDNYIDVPQWIVDPAGQVHLICCIDSTHDWVEIHPLSNDPATWGDQANWSAVTVMTDDRGQPLVQGNSFVALRGGAYYMAFNEIKATVYYLRTSTSLSAGWSTPRRLNLDSSVNKGDSENLVFLSDGTLRYYISNGNSLKKVMWYVDSADLGISWTQPKGVMFSGFDPAGINWAQVVRITDPGALAGLIAANQVSREPH